MLKIYINVENVRNFIVCVTLNHKAKAASYKKEKQYIDE